jgi:hypothetical protein
VLFKPLTLPEIEQIVELLVGAPCSPVRSVTGRGSSSTRSTTS